MAADFPQVAIIFIPTRKRVNASMPVLKCYGGPVFETKSCDIGFVENMRHCSRFSRSTSVSPANPYPLSDRAVTYQIDLPSLSPGVDRDGTRPPGK
jgi:hypothetical protein